MSPDATFDALLASARTRLAEVPRERLGELVTAKRILGIARAPRIVPRGEAWHLGVLLLTDDAVLETGEIVRAREEARRGYTAQAQRERAELAAAARRGGFAEGEAVHLDWKPIDLEPLARGAASGPLAVVDGVPHVRWSRSGGLVSLEVFLDERVDLLLHPPTGAT
jgi:hypothetical protein